MKIKYEKFEKIPNSLRGSLSCLGFIEDLPKCNKIGYAMMIYCITFQIENLGCYKPTPVKMNLALEIRVGLKTGGSGPSVDLPLAPRWLHLPCGDSTGLCKT